MFTVQTLENLYSLQDRSHLIHPSFSDLSHDTFYSGRFLSYHCQPSRSQLLSSKFISSHAFSWLLDFSTLQKLSCRLTHCDQLVALTCDKLC